MSNPYPPDPSGQNPYGPTRQSGGYDPYQLPQTYPQYNQPAPGSSGSYTPYPPPQESYPQYSQPMSGAYGTPSGAPPNIIVNVHQAQQQQQMQMQPVMVAVSQPTNGKATAALILGIISWLGGNILTGIPAIILGHMALNEINNSNGIQGGKGSAITGLILGYIASGGIAVCLFCYVLGGLAALSGSH
jgi:hypothetical protein